MELILCRDIYHCTPDQLDRQDLFRVLDHIIVIGQEQTAKRKRAESEANKAKRKMK